MNKLLLVLLLGLSCSEAAMADRGYEHGYGHGHGSIGFYFGAPYPYYPYPYYPYPYYPPVMTVPVPVQPPVYIEQDVPPAQAPQPSYYWYHCDNPSGYYPYVKECPGGWQKVSPTPAPQ